MNGHKIQDILTILSEQEKYKITFRHCKNNRKYNESIKPIRQFIKRKFVVQ